MLHEMLMSFSAGGPTNGSRVAVAAAAAAVEACVEGVVGSADESRFVRLRSADGDADGEAEWPRTSDEGESHACFGCCCVASAAAAVAPTTIPVLLAQGQAVVHQIGKTFCCKANIVKISIVRTPSALELKPLKKS